LLFLQTVLVFSLFLEQKRRRYINAELLRSNDRLRLALETGNSIGWESDLVSGAKVWFGDLRTVLGLRSDVYAGRVGDLLRHVHEEDQKRVLDGITQARDSHTPYSAEFRIVRADQSTRWVSARGRFEYSETGKPRRMRGMAVDISERKRADDLRKASEQKFSKVFHESP